VMLCFFASDSGRSQAESVTMRMVMVLSVVQDGSC
jgi:hypothetical protein